ncbi:hypothetical protein Tco_0629139 [Tanacetum coccineum]|uniref:Uncharacterized protein n=1 Tax=Tanacetum coccineum TaxID=301880 RepID=A0ABQ4WSE3_9ASTR
MKTITNLSEFRMRSLEYLIHEILVDDKPDLRVDLRKDRHSCLNKQDGATQGEELVLIKPFVRKVLLIGRQLLHLGWLPVVSRVSFDLSSAFSSKPVPREIGPLQSTLKASDNSGICPLGPLIIVVVVVVDLQNLLLFSAGCSAALRSSFCPSFSSIFIDLAWSEAWMP